MPHSLMPARVEGYYLYEYQHKHGAPEKSEAVCDQLKIAMVIKNQIIGRKRK